MEMFRGMILLIIVITKNRNLSMMTNTKLKF